MESNLKNKFTASFYHFLASLLIFSIFVFILFNFWYPSPYFSASGGWQGLKIVAAIDLIMGPVLTFVVYNINKPKKEFYTDFSIIVFLQLAVLWWGMATVYSQRPVAVVFWENGFYTVPASAIEDQEIDLSKLDKFGSKKPVYIFAEPPQTDKDREQMLSTILQKQIPPHHQLELYRPIEQHYDDIFKYNVDILEIISNNRDMKSDINAILKQSNTSINDNYYIKLISKYRNIILVYNQYNQIIGSTNAPFKDKWKR